MRERIHHRFDDSKESNGSPCGYLIVRVMISPDSIIHPELGTRRVPLPGSGLVGRKRFNPKVINLKRHHFIAVDVSQLPLSRRPMYRDVQLRPRCTHPNSFHCGVRRIPLTVHFLSHHYPVPDSLDIEYLTRLSQHLVIPFLTLRSSREHPKSTPDIRICVARVCMTLELAWDNVDSLQMVILVASPFALIPFALPSLFWHSSTSHYRTTHDSVSIEKALRSLVAYLLIHLSKLCRGVYRIAFPLASRRLQRFPLMSGMCTATT